MAVEPIKASTIEFWDAYFERLPPVVAKDYVRVLQAVRQRFDGKWISAHGLHTGWVLVDHHGHLKVDDVDQERLGDAGWGDLGDWLARAVDNCMRAYPELRCAAHLDRRYRRIPWPRRDNDYNVIVVRAKHRHPERHERLLFHFWFEPVGSSLHRRVRFAPELVALVQRWDEQLAAAER
jgi:hypothetical protein